MLILQILVWVFTIGFLILCGIYFVGGITLLFIDIDKDPDDIRRRKTLIDEIEKIEITFIDETDAGNDKTESGN